MQTDGTTKAELESMAIFLQAELAQVRDVQHGSLSFEEARRLWIREQKIQKELRNVQAQLRAISQSTEHNLSDSTECPS